VKIKLGWLALPGILLVAVYYAVFGGEYSYFALRRSRAQVAQESAEVAVLRHQIDSLKAWADSLQGDSATLERLARERYGMIRGGETLYRFAEPDDSADSTHAPRPLRRDTVP
jgi:cell division protein FtsB